MQRIALDFVRPGMELAKDVYGTDGRVMLTAGGIINESILFRLKQWEITSLYIKNPLVELPVVSEILQETTRLKAIQTVQDMFEKLYQQKRLEITDEHENITKAIIKEVLSDSSAVIHLAQIRRHHDSTFAHSINVTVLSTLTGIALGLYDEKDLYMLALGAMLHDVGKVMIPAAILAKQEPLSQEEAEIYGTHTHWGFELLKNTKEFPLLAAHIALQHHEKVDGTGYPRRLTGDSIHRLARIVIIANEFDNMIADRIECKGMEMHMAYETITGGIGTFFDVETAKAFLSKLAIYSVGTMVRLTSGDIGVVSDDMLMVQHRPKILIIAKADGTLYEKPFVMDLANQGNLTMFIVEVLSDLEVASFIM